MARRIDEVELVILPVLCRVVQGNGAGLDGDAAFPLDVHVVEDLVFHGALVYTLGQFRIRSERVDLPWSMCAMMQKLRMLSLAM